MARIRRIRSASGVAGCLLVLVALAPLPASACSTPVYRYAMYNWAAWPYRVYYFSHGEPAGKDKAVNKLLDELAGAKPPANVVFEAVDLSEDDEFALLPEFVKQAYTARAEGKKPRHLLMTPWGAELFAGRLDRATVRSMVASPARTKLAKLLAEGNAAILLLLTGSDAAENERAEKLAGDVVRQVAAGERDANVLGPSGGLMPEATDEDDDPRDAAAEVLGIAVLKVSRSNPAEKWLVDTLLSVEPDLHEFPDAAMIFAVYGRGQAMPPLIGKGINADNLIGCIAFLAGACSCMIKEANPGRDLLMEWDWRATADALAAEDDRFGDGPLGYQEFSVGEPYPVDRADSGESAIPPVVAEVADKTAATLDRIPDRVESNYEPKSFGVRQAWMIGLGLVTATIVVLLAGVALLRRRPPV